MKKLTVLQAKVGQEPEVVVIENTLEELQKLVGGYIEVVRLHNGINLIVNEEGMLMDLPINFLTFITGIDGLIPVHQIHGDVFFVSEAGEDFASLDKSQIKLVKGMFKYSRSGLIVR